MREIKFRGKRIDNKKWVYGNLIIEKSLNNITTYIIPYENGSKLYFYDDTTAKVNLIFEVIRDTVGQYTGLKDIEGKEIYEGDIVEVFNDKESKMFVVLFDKYKGMFLKSLKKYIIYDKYFLSIYFDEIEDWKIKVVGNIYDNLELLNIKEERETREKKIIRKIIEDIMIKDEILKEQLRKKLEDFLYELTDFYKIYLDNLISKWSLVKFKCIIYNEEKTFTGLYNTFTIIYSKEIEDLLKEYKTLKIEDKTNSFFKLEKYGKEFKEYKLIEDFSVLIFNEKSYTMKIFKDNSINYYIDKNFKFLLTAKEGFEKFVLISFWK